jgi:hypothetical protein
MEPSQRLTFVPPYLLVLKRTSIFKDPAIPFLASMKQGEKSVVQTNILDIRVEQRVHGRSNSRLDMEDKEAALGHSIASQPRSTHDLMCASY